MREKWFNIMYDFFYLQEGYCHEIAGETNFKASCSVSLLRKGEFSILIDTGSPWDVKHIMEKLHDIPNQCDIIDIVVCTHGHVDHIGGIAYFPNSTIAVGADMAKLGNIYLSDYSIKERDYQVILKI